MGDFIQLKFIDSAQNNNMEELEFCLNLGELDVNCTNEVSLLFSAIC